jgi:tRNA(His) guanylyltransferase
LADPRSSLAPDGQLPLCLVCPPAELRRQRPERAASVRKFELNDVLLPSTWLVARIDGKGFHAFSEAHDFAKPNDRRALDLMNAAARAVMGTGLGQNIFLAFGESDEYSFAFHKDTNAFNRRERCARA